MLTKAMRLQRNNSLADILSVDIDRSMPQDAKTQDFIQKSGIRIVLNAEHGRYGPVFRYGIYV